MLKGFIGSKTTHLTFIYFLFWLLYEYRIFYFIEYSAAICYTFVGKTYIVSSLK